MPSSCCSNCSRQACQGRASKACSGAWNAAAQHQLLRSIRAAHLHLMRQLPLQVEARPIVPQLMSEVLLVHVLPHLGDCALAAAACATRGWRRMAGEVRLRGSIWADACAARLLLCKACFLRVSVSPGPSPGPGQGS